MEIFGAKNVNDSITLYFVQDTGSNSKEMRNAFTICQSAKLKPNLVGEDEVEELPTRMNCVFVLEEFKGKVFRFLASKDCLVVGPKCLVTCIHKRIPIPENQSPVFNLAMHGLVICASKLKRSKKEELATVVGYMGGSYSDQLTLAVTHVVADDGKSDKCMKANELKIPIMCSSWVKAIWDASLNNDITAQDPELFSKYKLPPFKGLYITCSNLPQSMKLKLQKLIEGNGGVYMPALEQNKTSALIIGDPVDGKKFQHAQLWGIPCVKPSWLHESVEKQYQVPYKEHIVTARPTCSTPTSELPSFMSNDVSVVPLVNDVSNMEINETNTTLNSVTSFKALPRKIQKLTSQPNNDYKKHLEQLNMIEVNSAGLFLDGCKIYLSGFISQEMDKLKKVLNAGGATIFGQLTDSVSHVIVGDFNVNDAKAITECSQRPHVVSVEWLLASIECKGLAPVQQYLCLQSNGGKGPSESPSQLSSPLGSKGIELLKKPSNAPENSMNGTTPVSTLKHTSRKLFVKAYRPNRTINENNSMMERETNGDASNSSTIEVNAKDNINNKLSSKDIHQPHKDDQQVQKNPSTSNEGQPITGMTKAPEKNNITGMSEMSTMNQGPFFQGLLFMVVGFEDPSPIIAPIEEVGGYVVNAVQFQGVADYAVVPLDGTPEKFSSMETVTVLWIEDCWEQGKVLSVEYYHQPVVMKEGCCPLKGVTLCITGFIGKERSYIGHVATSLGAVVQDSFSRKDHPDKGVLRSTHLVCKSPQGSKYAAAKKWGLPTVSKDWLSSCAATGIKQPEENYRLDLDEVTTNAVTSTDHPAMKRLKISSKTPTSGADTPVFVENTPVVSNVKRPDIEITKPSTSVSSVNIAKEAEMRKTIPTVLCEDTMPREQEKTNAEAEEFCGFQTPRMEKSKLQSIRSSLAPDESVVEEQKPNFLSTSDRKRLSCLSIGPSPGHVDTPDSPYGQVFTDGTPSPQTRKRWKKWIDNLPDLYSGSPVFSRKRRPSTPLNVLLNQLWVKFGGAKINGIDPETGNLLPDGPFSEWAHEKSHQDIELQNGELVLKGTNISSADLSSDLAEIDEEKADADKNEKPASSANEEKVDESFTVKRRNLASSSECSQIRIGLRKQSQEQNQATPLRKETVIESKLNSGDKSSEEEYSPTQQRDLLSERLASRILEAKKAACSGDDYEFVDKNVAQGLKRRSPEVRNNLVDWDWTVANENAKKKKSENDSNQPSKRFSSENTKNSNSDESNAKEDDIVEDEKKEEEEEEEEEEGEEENRPKERRVFVLSNIPNPRDKYESIIHNLGGEISSSVNYDSQTTHLIIDKPVRSEKLLCCLASGKWVLHISYLTSCYQARTFLPEEDYEWGNERSRDRLPTLNFGSTEYHLAMSAYRWRIQRTEFGKVGVYSKFKAVLLTYEQKIPQYSRLLMAGGGTILDKSRIMEATHVFWDEDKVELPVNKRKLKANNIYLLKPIYLGDYLMKSQPPNPLDYIIK